MLHSRLMWMRRCLVTTKVSRISLSVGFISLAQLSCSNIDNLNWKTFFQNCLLRMITFSPMGWEGPKPVTWFPQNRCVPVWMMRKKLVLLQRISPGRDQVLTSSPDGRAWKEKKENKLCTRFIYAARNWDYDPNEQILIAPLVAFYIYHLVVKTSHLCAMRCKHASYGYRALVIDTSLYSFNNPWLSIFRSQPMNPLRQFNRPLGLVELQLPNCFLRCVFR